MVLEFTSEQMQNPKMFRESFKKICPDPGSDRDLQLTSLCWSLACSYQTLLNIIQHLQEEENASGSDPTLVTGTVASPTPTKGTAAEARSSPMPGSGTLTQKPKQWVQKSSYLVREETSTNEGQEEKVDEAVSRAIMEEEEAEINNAVTTRSLSLGEL